MTEIKDPIIIGFDILPRSSPMAKKSPKYAMAILCGKKIDTIESLRRSEVFKKIRRYQPDIIATDNLLELGSSEKTVIDFLSKIPSKTRVIQVTGSPLHGMTSLVKLAKRHGFNKKEHPTPIETAVLAAKLAALGVGTEISAIARETRIVISRARTVGSGGFSQARFQRRMHGMIQQVSRNILNKLKRAGMDFDQYESKTTHGLSRCVINVYESFDEVKEVIKSEVNRTAGVAVRLHPVKHRSILYLPTEDRDAGVVPRKLLVVGIDAGTTVGIAVADVSGNFIALHSGRGWSRGDVIRKIVEYGKPILIATDVSPVPNFIEKLSNSLKTQLFTPQKVLSVIEKRELAKSFAASSEIRPANAHQRDALAAVSKVFQTYENKLQLLDKKLVEKGQTQIRSEATVFILKGLSVNDAVEKTIAKIDTKTEPVESTQTPVHSKRPSAPKELKQLVQRFNRQIVSLQRQLEHEQTRHSQTIEEKNTLKDELQSTKRQLNRILSHEHREQRKDEKIRQKDEEIARLQKKIARLQIDKGKIKRTLTNLKLMRRLEIRGEVQPVLLLPIFSQEEIRRLSERYTKKRRKVVYILNSSGGGKSTADQLIQLGVKAIITKGAMSHLALRQFTTAQIPVIDAENLQMTIIDEFAVTDVQQLEQQIAEWHKHHAITERVEAANALERLVEEYRQERRKENSGR